MANKNAPRKSIAEAVVEPAAYVLVAAILGLALYWYVWFFVLHPPPPDDIWTSDGVYFSVLVGLAVVSFPIHVIGWIAGFASRRAHKVVTTVSSVCASVCVAGILVWPFVMFGRVILNSFTQ